MTVCAGSGFFSPESDVWPMESGLTGFEFAAGIPEPLGGAVVMNAGAYGGEMKDILSSVRVMERRGRSASFLHKSLHLSNRHSCVPERGLPSSLQG